MTASGNGKSPNGKAPLADWATSPAGGASSGRTPPRTSCGCAAGRVEHTLARLRRRAALAACSQARSYVAALGAMTGGQAVQMAKAGLKAIYLSGWQVAADANLAGQTYPDQSLYPANSAPALVRRLNNALLARRPDRGRRGQRGRLDCCRSSPTPRRASAARSTPTS